MDKAVIVIDYEFDISAVRTRRAELRHAVCYALAEGQATLLDLTGCDYLDEQGVACIVTLWHLSRRRLRAKVKKGSVPERKLRLCGLSAVMPVEII